MPLPIPSSSATSGTGLPKPTSPTAWPLNSGVYRFLFTDFIVSYSVISVVQSLSSPLFDFLEGSKSFSEDLLTEVRLAIYKALCSEGWFSEMEEHLGEYSVRLV